MATLLRRHARLRHLTFAHSNLGGRMLAMRSLSQKTIMGPAFGRSILIFTFCIGVGCTQKADDMEADLDPALKSPPVYTQDDLQDLFGDSSAQIYSPPRPKCRHTE